ncbi:MAG: polysaccharide deacetylase, partial [Cutibacterium granulosum]|nr:polysaccharide deacetylase [Cutibacterium granulosum]
PGREASKSHIGCDIDYAMAQMRSFVGSGFTTGAVRNPGGHMSWRGWSTADPAMSERHMSWIDWNALSKDAEGKPLTSTDEAVQNLKETAAEYGTPNVLLILNHDAEDKKVTARSVPAMVKYLKSKGYELGVIA